MVSPFQVINSRNLEENPFSNTLLSTNNFRPISPTYFIFANYSVLGIDSPVLFSYHIMLKQS